MTPVSKQTGRDAACAALAVAVGLGIGWLDLRTTEVSVTILALLLGGLLLGLLRPAAAWRWAVLLALGLPAMAAVGRLLRLRTAEPIRLDARIVLVAMAFALLGCYAGVLVRRIMRGGSMHLRSWTVLALGLAATTGVAAADGQLLPGSGPYLGQRPPGLTAEVFAPGLVSSSSFEHSRLEIAKDGTALYWVVQPTRGKQQIWATRRAEDGSWSQPAPLPIADGAQELPFLHSPALAPDGRTLYFSCVDLAEGGAHGSAARQQTLYAIDLQHPRWKAPARIEAWFPDPSGVWAYSFAADGDLYFDSNFRLYCMKRRGESYDPPTQLGNAAIDDQEGFVPFVAPDESYIIYSSSRDGAVAGSIDLYVTFRQPDGGWGSPTNLGPEVNTAANERFPSVSPDGKYFFFLRNDPRGDSSFYWIDAAIIQKAK